MRQHTVGRAMLRSCSGAPGSQTGTIRQTERPFAGRPAENAKIAEIHSGPDFKDLPRLACAAEIRRNCQKFGPGTVRSIQLPEFPQFYFLNKYNDLIAIEASSAVFRSFRGFRCAIRLSNGGPPVAQSAQSAGSP